MSLAFHWFLPTSGGRRSIAARGQNIQRAGSSSPGPNLAYLAQVARSAEELGFTGVHTPMGSWCEEAWLTSAALISQTERLKFMVAIRPGMVMPTHAAQMAATYQRLSGGRLLLNVVADGEDAEHRRFGDFLSQDERYARAGEFLHIVRGAWNGRPYDFRGVHYNVEGASVMAPPDPVPTVYFSASAAAAAPVAARYADVYLSSAEPPELLARKIAWRRQLAEEAGRALRFGMQVHTISRVSAKEAWSEAAKQLSPDEAALIGSHTEVADRIEEYAAVGVEEFVLSGYPHLEEAYWFGEGVLPELRRRRAAATAEAAGPDNLVDLLATA